LPVQLAVMVKYPPAAATVVMVVMVLPLSRLASTGATAAVAATVDQSDMVAMAVTADLVPMVTPQQVPTLAMVVAVAMAAKV
jgi:hypothetical protein